ncbi:MAG TPA: ATP-binding cassette domain-containing protein [Candidatus Paenibacillus intestinavium]|nr:ATP-binding cassette domain-containing protein [Candidatus Paenibacillus intestinavium]
MSERADIRLERVRFYEDQQQQLDYTFVAGRCYGISGSNGAGKTTLLEAIAGMRAVADGHILIGSEQLQLMRRRRKKWNKQVLQATTIQIQHVEESWLCETVAQELSLINKAMREDKLEATVKRKGQVAAHYLRLFGVNEDMLHVNVQQLSIGQQKKAALALAFTRETPWLLLDEPLAALDYEGQQQLLTAIKQRNEHGLGTIIISHQWGGLLPLFDHHITLDETGLVEQQLAQWQQHTEGVEQLLYEQLLDKQRIDKLATESSLMPSEADMQHDRLLANGKTGVGQSFDETSGRNRFVWNQKFDPRSILVSLLLCSSAIVLWNDWLSTLAFGIMAIIVISIFHRQWKKWFSILLPFTMMALLFTIVGGLQLGPFGFDLEKASGVMLRMTQLIVMIGIALPIMELLTPFRLQRSLEQSFGWLSLIRIPIYQYTMLISLIFRLIPNLVAKWQRTNVIARAKLNIHAAISWNGIVMLMMPFMRGSLKLADQLATSLELRGFVVSKLGQRIVYKVRWRKQDSILLLTVVGYCLLIAVVRLM